MSIVPYINALWPLPSCVNLTTYVQGMSDYEIICSILQKLNEAIHSFNSLDDAVTELSSKYDSLENFVNNYFDNLDVTEEINNKLDSMFASGVFAHMLSGFCPDWYGADTTGNTDSSAAFQRAFDDAAKTGGFVFLNPSATYLLTKNVIAKSSFDGMGAAINCQCPSTSDPLTLDTIYLFKWDGLQGFFVRNVSINEITSEQISRTLYTNKFFFNNCSHFTFENCSYANTKGGNPQNGFDIYGGCHHFTIKNFTFHIENAANGGNWVRAISADTYMGIVENCSFHTSGFGDEALAIWPETYTVHDITVTDCTLEYKQQGTSKSPILLLLGGTVGASATQNSYNLTLERCRITANYIPRNLINCYANAGTQPSGLVISDCHFEVQGSDEWKDSTPAEALALIRLHPDTDMNIYNSTINTHPQVGSRYLVRSNGPVNIYNSNLTISGCSATGTAYNTNFTACIPTINMESCIANLTINTPAPGNTNKTWDNVVVTLPSAAYNFFIGEGTHIHKSIIENAYMNTVNNQILNSVDIDYTHFKNCTFTANIKAPEITGTGTYNYGYVTPG